LLDLARRQKVDLAKISILALVEQYLEFIAAARRLRLELAAIICHARGSPISSRVFCFRKRQKVRNQKLRNLPKRCSSGLPLDAIRAAAKRW